MLYENKKRAKKKIEEFKSEYDSYFQDGTFIPRMLDKNIPEFLLKAKLYLIKKSSENNVEILYINTDIKDHVTDRKYEKIAEKLKKRKFIYTYALDSYSIYYTDPHNKNSILWIKFSN